MPSALLGRGEPRFSLGSYPRLRCSLAATWATPDLVLDQHLFHAILAGTLQTRCGDQTWTLGPGEAQLLPAGVPLRLHASGGRLRVARLRLEGIALDAPRRWTGLGDLETVLACIEERLLDGRCTPAEHRALAVLLESALERGRSGDPALIARLRRRIADDPTCTPRDLARDLDLTLDYATRLIRGHTGAPPRRFILDERLRLAADRLAASDQTWQTICADLGWRDDKLFLRQFRARFGLPPLRWRSRLA